ncbi:galactosyltransferase domain-containing protein [Ditylenchus destructor]|uniref:Hexosyltransferase n=1 Tax=Ditylenchus destructor TaxID=166010 RepID=A0AAD4QWC7_9BILA|nr:galactosyltransferase domain-containing protein [Ditylenchus destructor]
MFKVALLKASLAITIAGFVVALMALIREEGRMQSTKIAGRSKEVTENFTSRHSNITNPEIVNILVRSTFQPLIKNSSEIEENNDFESSELVHPGIIESNPAKRIEALLQYRSTLREKPKPTERPPKTMSDSPHIKWREIELKFANMYLQYKLAVASPKTKEKCQSSNLLVVVLTRPSSFNLREAIRNTWANSNSSMPPGALLRFAIGRDMHPENFEYIFYEQKQYDDLIVYDYPDQYDLLHVKMHAVLTWQQLFCNNVRFLFRVDDDTVADLSRLQYWIDTEMAPIQKLHPKVLFGIVRWDDSKIQRDKNDRWYVSREDFPGDVFPPYVFGPFYLISSEGVAAMLNHTSEVKAFSVDDAFYTGVLAEKAAGIQRPNPKSLESFV